MENPDKKNKKRGNEKKVETTVDIETKQTRFPVHHGENILFYRKLNGYSQEYMAAQLNILQPRFSELEKQEVIDDVTLEKVANILGLDIKYLKDLPQSSANKNFTQNGDESFLNMGDVQYTKNIHNHVDVEKIEAAYLITINALKEEIERGRKSLDSQAETANKVIEALIEEKTRILDKLLNYADVIAGAEPIS